MNNTKQLDEFQLQILAALYYLGELYYSEIIEFVPKSKAMANRRLKELEKMGLVKKRVDPEIRPIKVYYSITESGKAELEENVKWSIATEPIDELFLFSIFTLPNKLSEVPKTLLLEVKKAEFAGFLKIEGDRLQPTASTYNTVFTLLLAKLFVITKHLEQQLVLPDKELIKKETLLKLRDQINALLEKLD